MSCCYVNYRCTSKHMDSVREAVSVILEKLLEKLTTLEEYEESLTLALQVRSVDALAQVIIYFLCFLKSKNV